MFTGLVRAMGKVEEVRGTATGARLVVSLGELPATTGRAGGRGIAPGVELGDSVAVAGVCLTVAELEGDRAAFDAVRETLGRTTLGELRPGARVNLEPAIRAGEAMGGHFVTGHVDGVAVFRSRIDVGDGAECTFRAGPDILADVVTKGSIAVDGVSLTVAALGDSGFTVALVPHTLRATTLGELRPGSRVNVEADMLVKAVRRILEGARGGGGLSADFLREHGFG